MAKKKKTEDIKPFIQLRRRVLCALYENFKRLPYASIELGQLAEECGADAEQLNWNIVYLEKRGYVELGRSYETHTFVASSASITAQGIELIEDDAEFNQKFPSGEKTAS